MSVQTDLGVELTSPWPYYDEEQIRAAEGPLQSAKVNYWTGDEGRQFEREFATYFGVNHAVAVANGTVALDLAWHALQLKPGDEVIVTPRTFLASVSSIVLNGSKPVFADVDRDSGNITARSVEAVISERTRAILCVHLGGWPCDMSAIRSLSEAHNLKVVEDCAQSHGASIDGRLAGSFGDISAWSFCQDKIISTGGEGGMLTTDYPDLWERAWSFKDHGKSWSAVYEQSYPPGFRWLHESFGTNWRLTESQSAIGRVQLRRLEDWVAKRRANAALLISALAEFDFLRVPVCPEPLKNAYYRLYAYVKPDRLRPNWNRNRLLAEISAAGVPCFSGTCSEVYREKAFDGHSSRPNSPLPVARELGETSLCFLVHPTLKEEQIRAQIQIISKILKQAGDSRCVLEAK